MENQIVEKKSTELVVTPTVGTEEILSSAIVIPKILLMQGLSDFVVDGKAVMGDMVKSTTGEKLGGPDKPLEFIPLTFRNTWVLSELVGKTYEWRGVEPMNAANQDLPWEFEQNGAQWKRVKSFDLYALLVKDIAAEKEELAKVKDGEMPDPDKALLPVLISFRSTSFGAGGKAVNTHFAKARKFGLPGYVSTLRLKCYKDKNDKGVFYVYEVDAAGKTSKEDFALCDYWRNMVAQNKVQVDNSDEKEADASLTSESSF